MGINRTRREKGTMADIILLEDEDLPKKHGLPQRAASPSLLRNLQPGDEEVQPPPNFRRPVVMAGDNDVEIVDLVDSDDEETGRLTPPVPRNPELKLHLIKMKLEDEDNEGCVFIGGFTKPEEFPLPMKIVKKEEPNTPERSESESPNDVNASYAKPTLAPIRKEATDESWEHDPDWERRPNSSRSNPQFVTVSNTPVSTPIPSIPAPTPVSTQTPQISTSTSTFTESNGFPEETATRATQSSQPVVHQFVIPDIPGLNKSGTEKEKADVQEVRLILNDGSTKRFVEVNLRTKASGEERTAHSKNVVSDACQTGESIVNGEPFVRAPINLNLSPIGEKNGNRKRHHEDSTEDARGVRSCPNGATSQTSSSEKEEYTLKFSTPEELIDLITYCKECRIRFENRTLAAKHQSEKHRKKFCPYCYNLFSKIGITLKEHFITCHVTRAEEEKCPCFFCLKENHGLKEFEFGGLYQHICKAHLVPVETRNEDEEKNKAARASPVLPVLSPHIMSSSLEFASPNGDTDERRYTLDQINNYGGTKNDQSARNKKKASEDTRTTRPNTWRALTNEQKQTQQSGSNTNARITRSSEPLKDKRQLIPSPPAGTSNQTQRANSLEDESRRLSCEVAELSREAKNSIKLWWKSKEGTPYPELPVCVEIETLAIQNQVPPLLVKNWFMRHIEKKRLRDAGRSN